MRSLSLGNKAAFVNQNVKNAEASATLSKGKAVSFAFNGTDDGLAAVLLSTSTAAKNHALFAGIVLADILPGRIGEVRCYGLNRYNIFRRATRAATSDSWASQASLAIGHLLILDTVNNCLMTVAASVGATAFLPVAVLGEDLASYASSDSATSDTRTAITTSAKVFLRAM